jgi:hypothetical protein
MAALTQSAVNDFADQRDAAMQKVPVTTHMTKREYRTQESSKYKGGTRKVAITANIQVVTLASILQYFFKAVRIVT